MLDTFEYQYQILEITKRAQLSLGGYHDNVVKRLWTFIKSHFRQFSELPEPKYGPIFISGVKQKHDFK